jgi:hypothetical protein
MIFVESCSTKTFSLTSMQTFSNIANSPGIYKAMLM